MALLRTELEKTRDNWATVEELDPSEDNGDGTFAIYTTHHAAAAGTVGIRQKTNHANKVMNATPIAAGGLRVRPFTSDFGNNVYNKPVTTPTVGTRYRKRSAFATTHIRVTDAASTNVSIVSPLSTTSFNGADSFISVYDGAKKFIGYIQPANNAEEQTINFALPGTGVRDFYFVESGNTQGADEFIGSYITGFTVSTGNIEVIAPVAAANRVVVVGDSISVGDGSTNNSRFGWVPILRTLLGDSWSVASDGWGARYHNSLNDSTKQNAQANRIYTYLNGATRKEAIWALLTNDYGLGTATPAQVAGWAAAVWDAIHALDATIKIKILTPLWRDGHATNGPSGYNLAAFITAFKDAAATRTAFVEVIEGMPLLAPNTFHFDVDLLHPKNAGHRSLAQDMYSHLVKVASPGGFIGVAQGEKIQNTSSKVRYINTSTNAALAFSNLSVAVADGGTIHHSTAQYAGFEFDFYGEQCKVHFHANDVASGGVWEALIDGVVVKEINNKRPANQAGHFFINEPVALGTHTMRFRKKDPTSTDAIWFDAATCLGGNQAIGKISWEPDPPIPLAQGEKVQETSEAIAYSADSSWATYSGLALADGGGIKHTRSTHAYYEFKVDGLQYRIHFHREKSGDGGVWDIVQDGVVVATIDNNVGTTTQTGRHFTSNVMTAGMVHTVRVQKNQPTSNHALWADAVECLVGDTATPGTNL